jgi:hypothetical protein
VEFRANNLFKQLTVRSSYTFSKNLDNTSEIFSNFAGGNSLTNPQNPLDNTRGEYSYSGLDFPHQWSMLFSEQLPFYKDQKGLVGHVLGGWTVSGNYILASGQRYTPVQILDATFTAAGDYYDFGYLSNFIGVDSARPFIGNLSAPSTSVGIFAGDACNIGFVGPADPICALAPSQLVSLTAIGQNGSLVKVTNNDVRYILNAGEAQTIFGTPFGNAARNLSQDGISNIANASVYKNIKFSERTSFEFHVTFQNAFNHANFKSIDPVLDDAGQSGQLFGFGNNKLSDTIQRKITFGGKFTF